MCGSRPSAPPPPPPPPAPPPPAPPAPRAPGAPKAATGEGDTPSMDKSINQINKKGRSRLRIDPANNAASEGSGLNIPQ